MVVTRNYYVYLTESTDIESGDEYSDWISFSCTKVDVGFKCNNILENLPQHKSFEIKTEEYVMSLKFSGVRIYSMGTNAHNKISYNSLSDFCVSHAGNSGSTIYAVVYMDVGDGNPDYMDFPDDSSDAQDYMQCRVKSFKFSFEAAKGYGIGSITLEEEWG